MSIQSLGLDDNLNRIQPPKRNINPEQELPDKSVPYSKLRLTGSIRGTDLNPSYPLAWGNVSVNGGWIEVSDTWTFSSTDAPTYVVSTTLDWSNTIPVGARVRVVQTTEQYFLVTAIDSSTITLYGGTDYSLTSAAITSPAYSVFKSPMGFPLNPLKWRERFADVQDRTQSSPVDSTWYNLGSSSLSLPIGSWLVDYQVVLAFTKATTTSISASVTLSTTTNSETDADLTSYHRFDGASGTIRAYVTTFRQKHILTTATTPYYLNAMSTATLANLLFAGSNAKTIIRATSCYL